MEKTKPSWVQQWPKVWVDATIETLKEVVSNININTEIIKGITISSLYVGSGILVDKNI